MKQPNPNYLMNGSQPTTSKQERNAAKKDYKAKKERFELAAKEGRIVTQNVPIEAAAQAKEWFEKEGLTVLFSAPNKDNERLSTIVIETKSPINGDSYTLGKTVQDIHVRSVGFYASVEAKREQRKEKKPFEMTFEKGVALRMYEEMAVKFAIMGKVASLTTGKITLTFDLYDCHTQDSRTRRICEIIEYANAVKNNTRLQADLQWLAQMKDSLQVCKDQFPKVVCYYKRMTGKEMIEKGIANVIDSRSKVATGFQKLLNWLFARRNYTYLYFGNVIFPEQSYVVQCNEPLDGSQFVDFNQELELRYDFGEQVHSGYGLKLANEYFNNVAKIYNELAAQGNQIETDASSQSDI